MAHADHSDDALEVLRDLDDWLSLRHGEPPTRTSDITEYHRAILSIRAAIRRATSPEPEPGEEREMAHAHTCLVCDRVVAVGNFDCDIDEDHDFATCSEECAAAALRDEDEPRA